MFSASQSPALGSRWASTNTDSLSFLSSRRFVAPLLEAWQTSSSGCEGYLPTSETHHSGAAATQGHALVVEN